MRRREMRRTGAFWLAFAAIHFWAAYSGVILPSQPMGDVYLVYEPWSSALAAGDWIPGVSDTWVYPQLAILPMFVTLGLAPLTGYVGGWAVLVVACNAVGMAWLFGGGRSRARVLATWFWLIAVLALGPVGIYRIDAITVPIAVIALLGLCRHPAVAGALLAAAAWMKIWPGALLVAAVVALRAGRWRVAAGAGGLTAAVVAVVLALGGAEYLFGFVTSQTGRGMQIEAPLALPFIWMAALGNPAAEIAYDFDILTFQVTAPGTALMSVVSTPVLFASFVGITLLGLAAHVRGVRARTLLPPFALGLVLALIVFNKVGSPQFQTWLIAPVALWLVVERRRAMLPAALVVVSAALTQVIYPLTYDSLLSAEWLPVIAMTARDACLVALLVVAVMRLVRIAFGNRSVTNMPTANASDKADIEAAVDPEQTVPRANDGAAQTAGLTEGN